MSAFLIGVLALAAAGEPPRDVSISPSSLRIVRVPAVDAEMTPGGQVAQPIGATAYLVVSADRLGDPALASFGELRAPLSADAARSAAQLVASGESVHGSLSRYTETVYTPGYDGSSQTCSRAQFDVLSLAIGAPTLSLVARIEDPGQRSVALEACPRPHLE